jgi:hypothetical protein
MKQAHLMESLHHGKETTSRSVSAVYLIKTYCFISGIYKLFPEMTNFTSKKQHDNFGMLFAFTYSL